MSVHVFLSEYSVAWLQNEYSKWLWGLFDFESNLRNLQFIFFV